MSHHNRLGLARAGLVRRCLVTTGFVTTVLSFPTVLLATAKISKADAVFDFAFDAFAVAGPVNFADDFADGQRDSVPTSALVARNDGTVTVEDGGVLVLSDADGSAETITGSTVLHMDTVVLESMPITNSGTGMTTVTGALSPFPDLALPTPAETSQFAGVAFGSTTDSNDVSIGVMLAGNSVAIVLMETLAGTSTILGSDTLLRGDVSTSDAIILQISLDQSLDSAVARYSLDGGTSFVEESAWDSPPVIGGFDLDQDLFAQLSASAQTVPEPTSRLLGAAGLVALALLRRVRGGGNARNFIRAQEGSLHRV